jgi:hypothetical protein
MCIRFIYIPLPTSPEVEAPLITTLDDDKLEQGLTSDPKEQALLEERANLARLKAAILAAQEAYDKAYKGSTEHRTKAKDLERVSLVIVVMCFDIWWNFYSRRGLIIVLESIALLALAKFGVQLSGMIRRAYERIERRRGERVRLEKC